MDAPESCIYLDKPTFVFNGFCCDQDHDGFERASCGGTDCNDDPNNGGSNVNPRKPEICGDGIDNDCKDGDAACPIAGNCVGEGSSCSQDDCDVCEFLGGVLDPDTCYCWTATPVVVDISGNGFSLTNAANGVLFDIDGNGKTERLAWTAAQSDDAWLSLDRNGNAIIDNGTELFGNFTAQPENAAKNGFLALAEFDKAGSGGNGDGTINSQDTIFSSLRLWQDRNHSGISDPSELFTLPALGVLTIDLDYREAGRRDQNGNRFRYRTKVYDAHGSQLGRWAWDVILRAQ